MECKNLNKQIAEIVVLISYLIVIFYSNRSSYILYNFNLGSLLYLVLLPFIIIIFSLLATFIGNYLLGISISLIPILFIKYFWGILLLSSFMGIVSSLVARFALKRGEGSLNIDRPINPIPPAFVSFVLIILLLINFLNNFFTYYFLLTLFIVSFVNALISSTLDEGIKGSILLGLASSTGPIGLYLLSVFLYNKPFYLCDCDGLELNGKIIYSGININGNKKVVCVRSEKSKIMLDEPYLLWAYNLKDNLIKINNYIEIGISKRPYCNNLMDITQINSFEKCIGIDLSDKDRIYSIHVLSLLKDFKDRIFIIRADKDVVENKEFRNLIRDLSKSNNIIIESDLILGNEIMQKYNAKSSGFFACCIEDPSLALSIAKVFLYDKESYKVAELLKENAIFYPSCNKDFAIIKPQI
ncbi:MAG: hypothetical protein ACP5I6_06920 [Caldisphaera sp.]|jgi:hypothetical protein|nr:MAG: hypothetical protein C0172_02955 [Caldisphaera sp.]